MGSFPGNPFPFLSITPGLQVPGAYPPIYIGSQTLAASSPAFPTIANIPVFNGLWVFINVSGYGGTDVVSLRFNGDSGTNYWDRTLTVAAGGVVVVDTNTVSTTLIRMGLPINKGRQVFAQIGNLATKSKVVQVSDEPVWLWGCWNGCHSHHLDSWGVGEYNRSDQPD